MDLLLKLLIVEMDIAYIWMKLICPVSVLQCIEETLDTGVLSVEITGLPLQKFIMKPNFCLIATQNKKLNFIGIKENLLE